MEKVGGQSSRRGIVTTDCSGREGRYRGGRTGETNDLSLQERDETVGVSKVITFVPDTSDSEKPDYPKWTKPLKPWGTVYRAGEEIPEQILTPLTTLQNWTDGSIPPEMYEVNLTQMEEGERRLVSLDNAWKSSYVKVPEFNTEVLPKYEPTLHVVDTWWEEERPAISPSLVPFVQEYMKCHGLSDGSDLVDQFRNALEQLEQNGITTDGQLAAAAMIMWGQRHPKSDGQYYAKRVSWGERYPRIDYTAQEMVVGNLHFLCIDMGFGLQLGVHLRTAFLA